MVADFLNLTSPGTAFKIKIDMQKCAGAEDKDLEKRALITKTLLAAMGGAPIYKILVWVCGESFVPQFGSHIKNEPKKHRKIVNSDIVAFVAPV